MTQTDESIRQFTREVDSLLISAKSVPEMYRKLNVLDSNGNGGWRLLRSPWWIGDKLIAVLLRPDRELENA